MKINGAKELAYQLRQVPAEIGEKVLNQATRDGAKFLLEKAIERTPVRYGDLRESAVVKKKPSIETQAIYEIGFGEFYIQFIELGTKHAAARRPLRDAFELYAQETVKLTTERIRIRLDAAIRRIARRKAGR